VESSDPSKMWDRARPGCSLFLFSSPFPFFVFFSLFSSFFTANSPHASRADPGSPVYKGARVLEMMASAERRKGGSARRVLRARDTYNAIYSRSLSADKHPPPRTLRPRKSPAGGFFLVLAPVWNRRLPLFLLAHIRGIYQRGFATLT